MATLAALAIVVPAGAHAAGTSRLNRRSAPISAIQPRHQSPLAPGFPGSEGAPLPPIRGKEVGRAPRKAIHKHPHSRGRCHTWACLARITGHQCSNGNPRACVWHVIYKKGIVEPERAWLLRVPGCESSWDSSEVEPTTRATGLYQFEIPTWAGTPEGRGHPERIWSAYWQAFAASWLYEKDGGGYEWACK